MARPTVLVVETHEERRKQLSRGLAEVGYEVVAAENSSSGMRFATGLNPNVIVAQANVEGFGDLTVMRFLAPPEEGKPSTLVLLAEDERSDEDLPDGVILLPVAGLTSAAMLRKVRTLLVGMELGIEADQRLESLVGDLQLTPLFELLPLLQRSVVTGRLMVAEGEIALQEGDVIGARSGSTRAVKAFARLGRTSGGTFRLLLGPSGMEREIPQDLLSLMAVAMEDQQRFDEGQEALPDWESRVRFELGPAFFATHFTPAQQEVLKAAQVGPTIRAVVEAAAVPDGQVLEELIRLQTLGFVKFDEPEIKVRVVADSTCDLPPELARRHRIQVVPLTVIFGDQFYKDGIDLTPGAFYKLLASRKDVHPRTSPPTKGEFLTAFAGIVSRSDVVSVHISEKMSQTVVHARAAAVEGADELRQVRDGGGAPVLHVVDSFQVSAGLGLLTLMAARMAQRGVSVADIKARVEEMRQRLHLLFVVDTLEYLARGGRIGKARALLGGLLGIKPILGLVGGEVAPVDKVRGGKAAHPRLVQLFKERVDAAAPVVVAVAHAAAPVWADRLRVLLQESFNITELLQTEIGPVVGSHTGPGCVGAVMFQPTEEEAPLIAPLPTSE